MWFLKRKDNGSKTALKSFTGRQLQYVSKRVEDQNGVRDMIVGKGGRVAVHDNEIKIICGTESIFTCPVKEARCNLLLSGNGATVEGQNQVSGEYEKIIIHYNKLK